MAELKAQDQVTQYGIISFEHTPTHQTFKGQLGIQVAEDGRIWICIDGYAFLRFKPLTGKKSEEIIYGPRIQD